ncbi:hypothetical protein [Microbaculum sp. FT89]|uniref:hypothetical protein n=1 Tax=Microbaculum sp. FT89 TaxID=3447298 RepID=UPI003F53A9FD
MILSALVVLALMTALVEGPARAQEAQPEACPDVPPTSAGDDAAGAAVFDAYCGRCHEANKLAGAYFAGTGGETAVARQAELAAFLDRHSACPQRDHEALANWMRRRSGAP